MGLEICGVDEVGRGALAGPIFAVAVIFPPSFPPSLKDSITDSKRIPRKRRLYLARKIMEHGCVGIGRSDVEEIEQGALLQATLTAMKRAIETLSIDPDLALIDGQHTPSVACRAIAVTRGDSLSLLIGGASIVAKVTRDEWMTRLARLYPEFGWDQNAGYPTLTHKRALLKHGPTPYHRLWFKPVRSMARLAARDRIE